MIVSSPERIESSVSTDFRDIGLIILTWLIVIGLAVVTWASQSYYFPSPRSTDPGWLLYLLYLHLILLGICLPLVTVIGAGNTTIRRAIYLFQHPRILTVLLLDFGLAQVLL